MIIYGEYLFLENLLTGMVLLYMTGSFLGKRFTRKRVLFGGIVCGIGAFGIFIDMNYCIAILSKILMAGLICLIAFGTEGKTFKKMVLSIIKTSLVFLTLTFLSVGVTAAVLIWKEVPMIVSGSGLYVDAFTYGEIALGAGISFGLCIVFNKAFKRRKMEEMVEGKGLIAIEDQLMMFNGFIDSGNELKEPISKKPVVILNDKLSEDFKKTFRLIDERYVIIPYKSLGRENGLMEGYRTDYVSFRNKKIEGTVVALYKGEFKGYEGILHKDFLKM